MKTWIELLELFDTKISVDVRTNNDVIFNAFFEVPTEQGILEFAFLATHIGDEPWELLFIRKTSTSDMMSVDQALRTSGIGVFNDLTAKESFAVFSGVKTALMKWYNSRKPKTFAFTAKSAEVTRVKLYRKFAKQLAKKLNMNMISGKVKSNDRFVFSQKGFNG